MFDNAEATHTPGAVGSRYPKAMKALEAQRLSYDAFCDVDDQNIYSRVLMMFDDDQNVFNSKHHLTNTKICETVNISIQDRRLRRKRSRGSRLSCPTI